MNKSDLKKSIEEKELQLSQLKPHIDKSATCSDVYNKVLIEKAIYKKELEEMEKNRFVQKIKNFFPHKKVLICDYFKSK